MDFTEINYTFVRLLYYNYIKMMTSGHHSRKVKDARKAFHEEMQHNIQKKIFVKWLFRFLVCFAILMALFIVYVTVIKQ